MHFCAQTCAIQPDIDVDRVLLLSDGVELVLKDIGDFADPIDMRTPYRPLIGKHGGAYPGLARLRLGRWVGLRLRLRWPLSSAACLALPHLPSSRRLP